MQSATQPLNVIARIAAAILGGYFFTWGYTTLSISGMVALGVSYEQANIATMLLAFLILLSAFLWSFAATSIARVWLVLVGCGALMTTIAWYVQRSVVG